MYFLSVGAVNYFVQSFMDNFKVNRDTAILLFQNEYLHDEEFRNRVSRYIATGR
jgi:hypothetical protein